MAPVAGFVPDIISNVLRSPFLRKGNKTPRKGAATEEATASSSVPQAGSEDATALQSSPQVATLDNTTLSASVESVKEPPTAPPPSSFASLDSLASQSSLKNSISNAAMKLEPIIEQPTPSVTPNVSPPQEKDEPQYPSTSGQTSSSAIPSPARVERLQAHIVNDSPSSRTVTFLTAARASTLRTGVSFQSFGSPYPPSVDRMDPDGSADMSISSEDEPMVFATPPITPTLGSGFSARDSPPAVVLLSPSVDALPVVDLFAQDLIVPTRLSAPLRTASESSSDSRPSSSRCSSTGLSSDTGNSSSFPVTPLDAPAANGQLGSAVIWVGENAIEPIGVPLPTTYAEARDLANAYPEIAEELLKRPLASSRPHSRAPSCDGRVAATSSPAPTSDVVTSDADDADDERSQKRFQLRRREHSPDHPDWAVAPDEPKEEGRERKRHRGRGRERPAPKQGNSPATHSSEKPRNRRGRGRKQGAAASFERLHTTAASASEGEISPAQVLVESLLRGIKELTGQPSKVETPGKGVAGEACVPVASSSSASSSKGRTEALSKLREAQKMRESMSAPSSAPTTPASRTPGTSKIHISGPFGTPVSGRASPVTSTARERAEVSSQVKTPAHLGTVHAPHTSVATNVTEKPEGYAKPTSSSHSQLSTSSAQSSSDSPSVKLPPADKTAFSPMVAEFVTGHGRQTSNASHTRGPGILTGPATSSPFASSTSAFTALATNPAAAAIVNIANHAHSSAAELAKRASVSDIGGAANADAKVDARPPPPSVVNDVMNTPHLFSAPVANVNAGVPPSMAQPTFDTPVTGQPSHASTGTNPFLRTQPSQTQHTAHFTPSPASARMHARRGSTASLNLATPSSGSPSPAYNEGMSKRASLANLRGQPVVPSPLSRMSPLMGETRRSPDAKTAPSAPSPKIHAPTPVFGSMSKRSSVADLTAAAAASPFVPKQSPAAPAPASSPKTGPLCVSGMQPQAGGALVDVASAAGTPSRGLVANKNALFETPQRQVPMPRISSPAYAWTPATRPRETGENPGPGVIGEPRHHSAGGALAGYDAPPASPVVGTSEKHTAFDISSLAESMVHQLMEEECERRKRTFTNAAPPAALLTVSVEARQACESPASEAVQETPVALETLSLVQLTTPLLDLGSPSPGLQNDVQEPLITFGTSSQTNAFPQVQTEETQERPAEIQVTIHHSEDKPVRPPTPGGQASLTNLVAQLHVGDADAPIRPTSVVPNIHAGTPDQPAHWTIDDTGKLRAKRTEDGLVPAPAPEMELPSSEPSPSPPQPPRPAGPPPCRPRRAGEQPEAFKPYLQTAGPSHSPSTDRFSALRRRSMYFAREEGGVRGGSPDREGSPGGGAGLWRKGSGKWRKRVSGEDEE